MLVTVVLTLVQSKDYSGIVLFSGIILAALFLFLGWPKDKAHMLNRWQIPDKTTRRGLWLRAGLNGLITLLLVTVAAIALWWGSKPNPSFVWTASVLILLYFPYSYWVLRRQYKLTQTTDGAPTNCNILRYIGPSKVSFAARWLIVLPAGIGVGIVSLLN